jgi:hypothetical protein
MTLIEDIPNSFIDFFINPILEIDPFSKLRNAENKKIIEGIITNKIKINEAKDILFASSKNLLKMDIKIKILDYIESKCPENNKFPLTYFKQNLHHICQYIIRNNPNIDKEFIDILNDISLEYYANNYAIYSIKLYQKKGSIKQLINDTEYILEKYTGKIKSIGASHSGLGKEYHDIHTLNPYIRNEIQMVIAFNLNDPEYHDFNNIYINFWNLNRKKLWDDISIKTINKIANFLVEFFELPNLILKEVNISKYKKKTPLPDKIVEVIESVSSVDTSLKFDHIIEINYQFKESTYSEIRNEINVSYRKRLFAAMYVLIRKLLENLSIDCLRKNYMGQNLDKFFDENIGQFLPFEYLKKNLNKMKEESNFRQKVGTFDQKFIDIMDKFKDSGNIHSHSLFSINHQIIVEENRDALNTLIKRLVEIKDKL